MIAIWHGHLDIAKLLLQNERVYPPLNKSGGMTTLASLTDFYEDGHFAIAKILLQDER